MKPMSQQPARPALYTNANANLPEDDYNKQVALHYRKKVQVPIAKDPKKDNLNISLTARSLLYGENKEINEKHTLITKEAKKLYQNATDHLKLNQEAKINHFPGEQVVHLQAARGELQRAKQTTQPILSDLTKVQKDAQQAVDLCHHTVAELIKTHQTSAMGTEIREGIRVMTEKERNTLLNKPPESPNVPKELWAALQSPAALLFITPKQQQTARSNILLSAHPNFKNYQKELDTATMEINSINSQFKETKAHIDKELNAIQQKFPDSFKGTQNN